MVAVTWDDFRYTYEDYKQWEGDWELIDGVPVAMSPAPVRKYQSIASELIYAIRKQLDECPECEVLGEVDYKIGEETVLRPDVVLTCGETSERYLIKAPEIVIEIVSPSTARKDETFKFDIYEAEKVRYYILVYPDDLYAKIYKLKGDTYDKAGDFSLESYIFEETRCRVSIDFEKIFRKFRK